ncbi:MAG: DNA methyltransferase [Chloroflexota bacterium]
MWTKCLAGDTELFALINGQPIVSTLKDLVRIDLASNSIELPSYDEKGKLTWVSLTGWQKIEKSRGIRFELEDGTSVECTPEHRFPVARQGQIEMIPARDITTDDTLLQLGKFDLPEIISSEGIDEAFGEFIGWYLAEGSFREEKGLQLAMAADERPVAEALIEMIKQKFGIVGRIHIYRQSLHLAFPNNFMVALVKRFVKGNGAKVKRLSRDAFFYGKDFLRGVLIGYLKGDGHWEKSTQRWRLGLTRNYGLITDLGVVCKLLGYRLRFSDAYVPYQRGVAETIRGEIRSNEDDRWSYITLNDLGLPNRRSFPQDQQHSLLRFRTDYKLITRKSPVGVMTPLAEQVVAGDLRLVRVKAIRKTTLRTFYDLSVDGNHVFALANGLLTHNSNPMPNFRGVRFTNAHETLLWAQKKKGAKYTFNYQTMKSLNNGLQMRSDWKIPLCTGKERIKLPNGDKAHTTQKPEALLERVILASSHRGDVVLDPFFGTGTTGAVAKRLGRHWIGIERDKTYIKLAKKRIDDVSEAMFTEDEFLPENKRARPRIPFKILLDHDLLKVGQNLYFGADGGVTAIIVEGGKIKYGKIVGSIHTIGSEIQNAPCNGWQSWYYLDEESGERYPIDRLREKVRGKK